jgi:hypothetical protein
MGTRKQWERREPQLERDSFGNEDRRMSRDDIRRLIADHATGSLTETQRKFLVQAAVEDPETYNALAYELLLKVGQGKAGVRMGLTSARERPHNVHVLWWERSWVGGMVAAVSAALLIVFVPLQPKRDEVAVTGPPAPPAFPAPVHGTAPPASRTVPSQGDRLAPAGPETGIGTGTTVAPFQAAGDKGQAGAEQGEAHSEASTSRPSDPPPAATAASASSASPVNGRRTSGAVTGSASAAHFALEYTVEPGGHLKITPAGDGFLSVQAGSGGAGRGLFSPLLAERVKSGVPISLDVPAPADAVVISFSVLNSLPVQVSTFLNDPSGTVEVPYASANSHLEFGIRLKPSD